MTAWPNRVAHLADLASDALAEGDVESAVAHVGDAFTIVDGEGTQQHAVFATLLCVAADVAALSDELESARSLYGRAHQVAAATQADGAVTAKALVGLGSLAEADDDRAKAAEYYRNAVEALAGSTHEDAEAARAAIAEALTRVQ